MKRKPLSRQLDLNLLDLFDTIYKTRNLTMAGNVLGLSQPAMSHALARLREMYGDPLFVRLPQGLRPTPFAEQLAGPVSVALQIVRGTLDKAPFDPASAQHTFRIAMTDIGEQVFLPLLLRHLEQHAPGIRIETRPTSINPAALVNDLSTGDIDIALGFISRPGKGIFQKFLFRDRYVCVVRGDHPLVGETLSLEDFRNLRHIVPNVAGTGHGDLIGTALANHGIRDSVMLRVTHFLSIAHLVANTDMVAMVPRNLANTFAASWKLRQLQSPLDLPLFDVTQYWHERYHQEPSNRWLRELIEAIFTDFPHKNTPPGPETASPAIAAPKKKPRHSKV